MIELGAQEGRWRPLVIKTTWGRTTAREKLVRRSETELAETLRRRLTDRLMAELRKDSNFAKLIERVAAKKVDPYSAAEPLVLEYIRKGRRLRKKP